MTTAGRPRIAADAPQLRPEKPPIAASSIEVASAAPRQLRSPAPKGRYPQAGSASSNRSGRNAVGRGQSSGSRWVR